MKMEKWKRKLTESERNHVKEYGGRTFVGFKNNREIQRIMALENAKRGMINVEPCMECRLIALKLGIEV